MNTPLFIARKMGAEKKKLTGLVKIIAILSISLGLAVMILAISVVTGFQSEIRNKVIGFGSHIQISNFDYNVSYETRPVNKDQAMIDELEKVEGVRHIQSYTTKPGIIKTHDEIHGVIFKGIGSDYDYTFFADKITSGKMVAYSDTARSNDIIISAYISRLLQLEVGDDAILYFIQEPPRVRRFTIAGIYETGLEELDKIFVLGDMQHLQRLNNWDDNQVGGIEILIDNYRQTAEVQQKVLDIIPYTLNSKTIQQVYPQIFDWLNLLDMNVYVIIVIMILVAGINMITTLLISVLEKTNLIGILKALGSTNKMIRSVFLYHAGFLIARGLLLGNTLGIGLALIQKYTGFIKLSQESYFVDVVPINFNLLYILGVNAGTFIVCMLMLIIPSYIISRISPVKAITFR